MVCLSLVTNPLCNNDLNTGAKGNRNLDQESKNIEDTVEWPLELTKINGNFNYRERKCYNELNNAKDSPDGLIPLPLNFQKSEISDWINGIEQSTK